MRRLTFLTAALLLFLLGPQGSSPRAEAAPGLPTANGPLVSSYPSTGHWEGYALASACPDSGIESRVCAEWFDASYPDRQTVCCISRLDLGSTDFSDCREVVYTGPRPGGGGSNYL